MTIVETPEPLCVGAVDLGRPHLDGTFLDSIEDEGHGTDTGLAGDEEEHG